VSATPATASSTGGAPGDPPVPVTVAQPGLSQDFRAAKVVLQRELIRFVQDRTRIVSAMVQPVLFLFVLGTGLSSLTEGGMGGVDLRTFMFPGILATSTLFTAMFSAVSIVWDREFGFLREMLVAPVRRSSIMIGKTLGGATVATLQACLVMVLAPLVDVSLSPGLVVVLILLVFLLAFTLTAFGLVIAARIQQMQTVMSIMQMLLLPLSFLSGALYPISNLPDWLHVLVRLNPITYAVNAVRTAVFDNLDVSAEAMAVLNPPITWWGWQVPMWLEVAIVAVLGIVFLVVAVKQFEKAE
jgi:ABC-2 type transport system permease protein